MKLTKVPLVQLVPDERNARLHNDKNINAIKASLNEFGQFRALVVQKGTNKIAAGNGVYRAMKELGWETVDVEYRELDSTQFTRLALADNKTAELAEWDTKTLEKLIEEAGDLSDLGFDAPDLSEVVVFGEELNEGKGQPDSRRTYGMLDGENTTAGVFFGDVEIRVVKTVVEAFVEHLNQSYQATGISVGEQLTSIFQGEINKP